MSTSSADGDDIIKGKALTQLASELKKRCPSREILNDLIPKAIRAKADINEALPKVSSKEVQLLTEVTVKNDTGRDDVFDALEAITDQEVITDAQNSADDRDEDEGENEIPNALPLNPLQQAAYNGHMPSINVLLNHNVDIDRKIEECATYS